MEGNIGEGSIDTQSCAAIVDGDAIDRVDAERGKGQVITEAARDRMRPE